MRKCHHGLKNGLRWPNQKEQKMKEKKEVKEAKVEEVKVVDIHAENAPKDLGDSHKEI